MAWHGSTRAERLPDDWNQRKHAVKARARGKCEATHHTPGCPGVGREVDHIIQGDDHSLDNLQLLSTECHKAKTRHETIKRNKLNAKLRRRPQEQHPGRRTP